MNSTIDERVDNKFCGKETEGNINKMSMGHRPGPASGVFVLGGVMVGSGYRDMAVCWISAGFCPPKLYLSSYESYECPEYENYR